MISILYLIATMAWAFYVGYDVMGEDGLLVVSSILLVTQAAK